MKKSAKFEIEPLAFRVKHITVDQSYTYSPEDIILDVLTGTQTVYPNASYSGLEVSGNRIFVVMDMGSLITTNLRTPLQKALREHTAQWKGIGISTNSIFIADTIIVPVMVKADFRLQLKM